MLDACFLKFKIISQTQKDEEKAMKRIFLCSLVSVAASLFLGCAPQGEDPEKMITAAKALDQQFIEAWNKGDVDAIMATYWNNPELISYQPDTDCKGWQATKDGYVDFFANAPKTTVQLIESTYKATGDFVVGWGKVRMTEPSAQGAPPMETLIRFTNVIAKRDGKWVYVMDHASVPLPPIPPPARSHP